MRLTFINLKKLEKIPLIETYFQHLTGVRLPEYRKQGTECCPSDQDKLLAFDERLTSLGNGTQSVPPSHIEMYFGFEAKRPRLRGSFLIGVMEGTRGCGYGDCFGDIQCDGNFSE
ncbi:hypothetical protein TNCV_2695521 [Trichonephila clavipes]|nr:hypothetical protein TNCV_2695521 [Trichonephila clavipes]